MDGKKTINLEVENFVKGKREELEKMIPDFTNDRKFTNIVLNFYERGIREGAQMMFDRIIAERNATHVSAQMSETSESDFKELWKDNKTYEHVPLPKSILKILKGQHNGYVLHAFIYHDTKNWADRKDHKSMVLGFDKIIRVNNAYIERGPRVCCGIDSCVRDWDDLAREIAFDYPEYAKE